MHPEIEQSGFALVGNVLDASECSALRETLGPVSGAGERGLLGRPGVVTLAQSDRLLNLIRPHLPAEPQPVRAIYFDKSAEANWGVPWHQDLTIALRARTEVVGFGPWSTKEGIPHVQPPAELLAQMLTLRLHLDDTDESNGALHVLPGSHREGRLTSDRIQELRAQQTDYLCVAAAGDALLMRPLLLHASGRSTSPRHRRVLHIEYAGFALPTGLEWHEAA
ncbi:Phytanoyl-CoA dioxygenase [Chthoniobacter flavus Ellin428]|uniref:Phytanoyl-CoA dioxygenase n=1 Tax=Chthoniobacter flavus Ellin428 TaxID=497964 RepID=B4CZM3_9BACT|nr:phytanoyl-CoA dioxygenase family protein [Chthoniobacter flavus]EDY20187.1 Phytanoyl-CoA dioxygenase [Chthoniobacter flavus Ellin428]TCO94085.1 phytanoyl-CoA dioxygenase PhyH [Chthoniobacter flavus]